MKFFTIVVLLVGCTVFAQEDRPSEDSMFGVPAPKAAKATPSPKSVAAPAEMAQETPQSDAFATGAVSDNPLQIGGIFYQQLIMSAQKGVDSADYPLAMPLQFDMFLDARPSDRVRAYVDERLLYDSTKDQYSRTTTGKGLDSLFPATIPNNPQTVLDQAWLKFDIDHRVFVTAGRQHLKWGTSRFWNPTDFLSTQKRDPLQPYDLRLGNTMAKFEIPLESQSMNLYGIGLFDNPQPASTAGQLGAAFRAEKVFGETEIGVDFITRGHNTPTYGIDISSSLGPFDAYAESALLTSAPLPHYTLLKTPVAGDNITSLYSSSTPSGIYGQTSAGINYEFGWRENRMATVGIEYFHNPLGYDDARIYPLLFFVGAYQPFYMGRDYAAVYITAEGPDSGKKTSYTLSNIANLSDKSVTTRLDFSWQTLTYLTFQAYAAVHYGAEGGEFNFTVDTPSLTSGSTTIPAIDVPPTTYELGMSLRLSM